MSTTPSPISTGAGGSTFEHSVQTEFICLMIGSGKVPINRFEAGYIIDHISFQARYKDVETDDMVVTFQPKDGSLNRIFAQMKTTIRLTDNSLFKEVIDGFWKDFNNPSVFNKNNDVFTIIMGLPTNYNTFNNASLLLDRARSSLDYQDFHSKVIAYDNMEQIFNVFKSAVEGAKGEAPSQSEMWEFLRCIYILYYDYNNDASQSKRNILNFLDITKKRVQGMEESLSVWNNLFAMVAQNNFKAGILTPQSVFNKYPSLIEWFDQAAIPVNPVKVKIDEYKIGMSQTISSSASIVDEEIRILLLESMEDVYTKLVELDIDVIKGFLDRYHHPRESKPNLSVNGIGELFELLTYINCRVKNWSIQNFEVANLKLVEQDKSGWVQLIYSTNKFTFPMIILDLGMKLYNQTPYNNYFDNRWIIENANMDSDNENLCDICGLGKDYPFSKLLIDFGKTVKIDYFEDVPGNSNGYTGLGNVKICCAKCIRKVRESENVESLNDTLWGVLAGD